MATIETQIQRHNVIGNVKIRFTKLPEGVHVIETESKSVAGLSTYTLRAEDAADLVERFSANVTASAGPGNVTVSLPIEISVKAK